MKNSKVFEVDENGLFDLKALSKDDRSKGSCYLREMNRIKLLYNDPYEAMANKHEFIGSAILSIACKGESVIMEMSDYLEYFILVMITYLEEKILSEANIHLTEKKAHSLFYTFSGLNLIQKHLKIGLLAYEGEEDNSIDVNSNPPTTFLESIILNITKKFIRRFLDTYICCINNVQFFKVMNVVITTPVIIFHGDQRLVSKNMAQLFGQNELINILEMMILQYSTPGIKNAFHHLEFFETNLFKMCSSMIIAQYCIHSSMSSVMSVYCSLIRRDRPDACSRLEQMVEAVIEMNKKIDYDDRITYIN